MEVTVDFSNFVAFWAVSILFILTPGVDWAYVISAGIHGRVVVPAVAGLLAGHLAATITVATGIGALLSRSPVAMSAMTMFGATYLLWLGVSLVRHPSTAEAGAAHGPASWRRWALKGVYVSGLNPKVFLLLFALLPQFVVADSAWPVGWQIFTLGLVHIASCGAIYLLVGYAARTILAARPHAARLISRFSGCLMIVIALLLLIEQLRWFFPDTVLSGAAV